MSTQVVVSNSLGEVAATVVPLMNAGLTGAVQGPQAVPSLAPNINITVSNEFGSVATTVIPLTDVLITAGAQGLQGIPGPPGPPAAALIAPAGVNITEIGTVVVLTPEGTLIPSDPTDSSHAFLLLGMNLSLGSITEEIQYLTVGEITGMSGLLTGKLYFTGLAGSLIEQSNLPITGAVWQRALGNAQSSTSFILDKQTPILNPN